MEQATKELVLSLCKVLDDKKAVDIKALYVADKTIVAEWFVVCSGRSSVQVKTLCDTYMACAWMREGNSPYKPYYEPSNKFNPDTLDEIRRNLYA